MPTQSSHQFDYIEPERHDGLSTGVASSEQREATQERNAGGSGIKPGATVIPAMGGRALKGRSKLTHDVPAGLPVSDTLKRRARFARRKVCSELARTVGAGKCGMLASLFAKLGLEDTAMREAALERGEIDLARKLGESARMHLLYARETCAKDAKVSPAATAFSARLEAHLNALDLDRKKDPNAR